MTAQPKACLDNFHPVRILGEGGFGKVILAKKNRSDGCDQHFALKVLKKANIMSSGSLKYAVTEKEALVLASGSSICYNNVLVLPNKGNFQFIEPASYFQRVINTEIYHQFENVMCRCICKIAKMDYELHHVWLSVYLSVCLSVCVEQLSSHWTLFH